jgi:ATP-binding cassette subfamily B protein
VDKIVVLESGRIVQQGSHDQLLATGGLYQRLFELQQQSQGWSL